MKATIRHKVVIENDWRDRITKVLDLEQIPDDADIALYYVRALNETVIIAKYEKEDKAK